MEGFIVACRQAAAVLDLFRDVSGLNTGSRNAFNPHPISHRN